MTQKHWLHATLTLALLRALTLTAYAQEPIMAPAAAPSMKHAARSSGSESRFQSGKGAAGFQGRMERALGLTPEQRETVRGLLAQQRQEMQALRDEVEPKYSSVREGTDAKIRAVLNPEQQKKFDAFLAKQKQARSARTRKTS